jgi:hypothetical protein
MEAVTQFCIRHGNPVKVFVFKGLSFYSPPRCDVCMAEDFILHEKQRAAHKAVVMQACYDMLRDLPLSADVRDTIVNRTCELILERESNA